MGVPSVLCGITSVLWRLLSTMDIRFEILRIFKESLSLFQKFREVSFFTGRGAFGNFSSFVNF